MSELEDTEESHETGILSGPGLAVNSQTFTWAGTTSGAPANVTCSRAKGETLFPRVNTEEGLAAAPHKGKKESNYV